MLAEKRHHLARAWAALGYASGHMLMAPHRQWCHTPEEGSRTVVADVDAAIRAVRPAVTCGDTDAWVLPRIGRDRVVIHLVNRAYDPGSDAVRPLTRLVLGLDLQLLGVPRATRARVVPVGATPRDVVIDRGRIVADVPDVWTMVEVVSEESPSERRWC